MLVGAIYIYILSFLSSPIDSTVPTSLWNDSAVQCSLVLYSAILFYTSRACAAAFCWTPRYRRYPCTPQQVTTLLDHVRLRKFLYFKLDSQAMAERLAQSSADGRDVK